MHAVTTQQFLHGDCIDFSLVLSRCMHAGLRHIAHATQNSAVHAAAAGGGLSVCLREYV